MVIIQYSHTHTHTRIQSGWVVTYTCIFFGDDLQQIARVCVCVCGSARRNRVIVCE